MSFIDSKLEHGDSRIALIIHPSATEAEVGVRRVFSPWKRLFAHSGLHRPEDIDAEFMKSDCFW